MFMCVDLELNLRRYNAETYTVELRLTLPGSDADVHPGMHQVDLDVDALLTHSDPVDYGRALTQSFFADPALRAAFGHARAAAQAADLPLRLRLFIAPGAEELHTLHWETLRDPENDALLSTGEQVYFSRYLSSADWRPVRLRPQSTLRALVVVANPADLTDYGLTPLDVTSELTRARESFGDIPITVLPDNGGRSTLNALMDALRTEAPDILYLVCHGALRRGESWLWLEDESGQTACVSGTDLTARLNELKQRPRLIVLASCQSAGDGAGTALTALGPQLAASGVPAVLAMQEQISIATVTHFMPRFFQEVQRDGQIDRAVAVARGAVRSRPDAWQPALFMRLKDGKLFDVASPVRRWPKILSIIAILALLGVLAGGLYGVYKPAAPLTGTQFNIAIAKFSSGPSRRSASSTGAEMAFYLKDTLRSIMSDLGYSEDQVDIGVYPGVGAQTDLADALLAEVMRESPDKTVTLLVYGYEPEAGSYRVYFRLRNLQEGTEVGDEFLKRDVNQDTQGTITAQSEVLAAFTSGLVKLYAGDLAKAQGHFETGIAKAKAAGLDIALDTLYFFLGRTLAALTEPETAREAYTMALSYNPEYAMAHIGLGNLTYNEVAQAYAVGEPVRCEDLDPAMASYRSALESLSKPSTAWVEGKACVMIGNVYSLCGQVEGDIEQLTQAVAFYDQALAAYERDDARVEYLAMVHYVRGLACEQLGYRTSLAEESTDAANWYENAITEYTLCTGDAGTRVQLAQDCSKGFARVREVLEE